MTPSEGFARNMPVRKFVSSGDAPSISRKHISFPVKLYKESQLVEPETNHTVEPDLEIDIREVYFLIMHFLASGPCRRTSEQLCNELLEHQLLPKRYHAWYSRNGRCSGDEHDDGMSFPLSYNKLVERYPHIRPDHLIVVMKQLILHKYPPSLGMSGGNAPNAADIPTLLGTGSFSLIGNDREEGINKANHPPAYMRWPHMKADQVRGLSLREIGGGFSRHQRAPSVRAACYVIAKPSTMVQKMQNVKKLRGHRNAVYCAIFDRLGRYVITGSDDRLVKIWSMETAYCLASCRGHEGDITDLAVSSNNAVVASSSNDFNIRVWRLLDGQPIAVLRGHTGAVTAIAFSPRLGYQLLSSSDDGTCRMWDLRNSSQHAARIYIPRPSEAVAGRNSGPSLSTVPQGHQIFCCAFNANGTIFVTGSSDTLARVWNACKPNSENSDQPIHEIDVLAGHENDVNYVQFSGCAVASRFTAADKEVNVHKPKNMWFNYDNIVTCSRDGSAIIWVPRSRRSHGKAGRWTRAYHLKVPPPPMPPQPARGGPRQRILPTPRGVNMIIWSLDNHFVLAAIMDCRICVWNASDGSLVHSLTGHTDSTYVLDVHPFNPRIAMSAGYDGKTIIWDIWEGTPIRTYEISRFKLVDGKFSSDGTSIILSDDVGQLYILSTGQGESQKDAKYDQFFLGDYRPLIHDTHGSVIDQETQLTPYNRNMQDLLCDSGMIPYPEPYQSTYQQRRLGGLRIEWKPSSLKFSVGPDFSLDQDHQMLPLVDLDMLLNNPLPEILDVMDWEPENEVQSHDTDSEYKVIEDDSSRGEQGSLSSNSSVDPEGSDEETVVEDQTVSLRRSKRKQRKGDIEIMTSSGRRVKRRNLEECDGNSVRGNRPRNSRAGHKHSKKKSKSKTFRPRRAAARNALHLFSKITGTSTDGEDEDGSGLDLSESESSLQDSDIESDESEKSLQITAQRSKGKEVFLDETEDLNAANKRLILKFPSRFSTKHLHPASAMNYCSNLTEAVGSSSKVHCEAIEAYQSRTKLQNPEYSFDEANATARAGELLDNVEGNLCLSEANQNGNIRWGGSRARTSKCLRMGETFSSGTHTRSSVCLDGDIHGHLQPENNCIAISPQLKIHGYGAEMGTGALIDTYDKASNPPKGFPVVANVENPTCSSDIGGTGASPKVELTGPFDTTPQSIQKAICDGVIPTPIQIGLNDTAMDPESTKLEMNYLPENSVTGNYSSLPECSSHPFVTQVDRMNRNNSDNRNVGSPESEILIDKKPLPTSQDSTKLHRPMDKMYSAVYRRTRSHKGQTNLEGGNRIGENASCLSNNNPHLGVESNEDVFHRTRSSRQKVSTNSQNHVSNNVQLREEELEPTLRRVPDTSENRCQQLLHQEWGSSSRITLGLRSARNRRSNYNAQDTSPTERQKSRQPARKGSWLMITDHECGSRYIPQLGDEVAYLRQGHQEYLDRPDRPPKEVGPWMRMNIRAVEFCKVVELKYSTLSGSGDSSCMMYLEFIDPTSDVCGKSFKLTLTEMTSFADFLVEKSRYEASVQRKWTSRNKCKVWWKNEGEEDGNWWHGRVVNVQPKSSEFPDSPWEIYTIRYYKGDPPATISHSPWELYDDDTQWEQPHINDETKAELLSVFNELEESATQSKDPLGVEDFRRISKMEKFRNRFPVPLSLEMIQARLENDYYRSLEALEHDMNVMLSNFESHVVKNEKKLLRKIKRLSDWWDQTVSSLQRNEDCREGSH